MLVESLESFNTNSNEWYLFSYTNTTTAIFGFINGIESNAYRTATPRTKIRENFFTRHKFTKLLKSILWPWFMLRAKFWVFNVLDSWKMAFPHLKGKLTVLEKNIKMKLTLLRKVSKIVHFTDFFLCRCSMYSHFEFEWKK